MNFLSILNEGVWNVGVIKSSIDEIMTGKPYDIQWMKHNYTDRFFADPFLLKDDSDYYYIFAEEYKFIDRKGRIVLLTIRKDNMKLVKKELIIDEQFHLSYPIVYKGAIHPECFRSGCLSSYIIEGKNIRKHVELHYPLIDPTFLEYKGIEWVFGTSAEGSMNAQRDLMIFYKEYNDFLPHNSNPVKSDLKSSRPGGNFFIYNNHLYRPVQNCEHFYGESIKIMKVTQLSKQCFTEEEALNISDNSGEYEGIHTFNMYPGFIVVDGYKERPSISKLFYIKLKYLYNFLDTEKNLHGYTIVK